MPHLFHITAKNSDVFCCFLGSHWLHLKSARNDRQLKPLQRTSCLVLFSSKSYYVVLKSVERFEKSACVMHPCALGSQLPNRTAFMIYADRKLWTQSMSKYIQIAKVSVTQLLFKQLAKTWMMNMSIRIQGLDFTFANVRENKFRLRTQGC